ncbi:hypothetical protein RFI_25091 [Reticulomyxa filosa]|uniref:Rhodanese domain-containing protein n=1 Tax=Reticulomyxa filosa TaxID=46433 RepID=X6ME45_RETFI|nr:hypothetical protein RFI_25091 [Reticulomyxa filosa]|eukprot:ETO12283.1 hypothetical protein RFI_25091 [Reticulomyxa filosa]
MFVYFSFTYFFLKKIAFCFFWHKSMHSYEVVVCDDIHIESVKIMIVHIFEATDFNVFFFFFLCVYLIHMIVRSRDISKQLVIDLSHEQGYRRGHVPGAVNLSLEKFNFTRKVDVHGGITRGLTVSLFFFLIKKKKRHYFFGYEIYNVMKNLGLSNDTSETILYDNSTLVCYDIFIYICYILYVVEPKRMMCFQQQCVHFSWTIFDKSKR